jgi:hypothetical protein
MMKTMMIAAIVGIGFATGASAAALTDLEGDKDCFGTGGACIEDGVTWVPGLWGAEMQDASDPADMDIFRSGGTGTWTHTFAPGAYTNASLSFLTAGIGDIGGPYDVFADGTKIGEIPFDGGTGHILAETFTFAVPVGLLADGSLTVSFAVTTSTDAWAVDYSELTADMDVIPLPAAGALMLGALAALGAAGRRRAG